MKALFLILVIAIFYREWPREGRLRMKALYSKHTLESLFCAIALGGLLFSIALPSDPLVLSAIDRLASSSFATVANIGRLIGTNSIFWIGMLLAYVVTLLIKSKHHTEVVFGAMLSAGVSGLIANVLKLGILRARPAVGLGAESFFNLNGYIVSKGEFLSFPSGDVAIVAGAAYFLFFTFESLGLRILFFVLPLLTAASRISLGRHWPSDTFISMLVALIAAHIVSTFLSKQSQCSNVSSVARDDPR